MSRTGCKKDGRKETRFMADKYVVDASVALKWQFKDEKETETAMRLLADFVSGEIELLAPTLFAYEIANAVHIAVSRERIPEKDGMGAIKDILALGIRQISFDNLVEKAFILSRNHKRSLYDCSYLALAEYEVCLLYTADQRFYNALKNNLDYIKWVGDYGK